MSGIFGLLRFDDQPVDLEDLNKMRAGLAHWGPDGSALWNDHQIGLGHLLLRNTPESIYETSPLKNASGALILTASARLDNRAELFHALDMPDSERAVTPDVTLILRAYERWGEECVHHLLGDWAFGLWDGNRQRLFLARDHHGVTGLFYYRSPRFFAFASSLTGLLALPDIPRRPNALRVAEILVAWPKHGSPTAYEDLHRLPPAHCFTVSAEASQPRRYWYLEHVPDLRLGSDAEYVEAFLEIFSEAVRCRLRSLRPVGATLSGGLDSGSVSALAARELGLRGERLATFTSVPIFDPTQSVSRWRFGDESAYVAKLAGFSGNIDATYVNAEQISPLAGIQRYCELHNEPGHGAANSFWISAILQEAQGRGLGTLLIAQNGNVVVSWTGGPIHPWHHLLAGRWDKFQRDTATLLKATALWQVIRQFIVKPFRRSPLTDLGPFAAWQNSAINPALAARLQLRHYQADDSYWLAYEARNGAYPVRYTTLRPGANILGSGWADWGAGYGLEVRDPTVDKRLIEFCFAIPDDQYRKGEQDRWLIRRGMEGLLPDEVRLNRLRGKQSADIVGRVQAASAQIKTILGRLDSSTLASEYLNLPLMRETLEMAGRRDDRLTVIKVDTILLRGLSAGIFLLAAEEG